MCEMNLITEREAGNKQNKHAKTYMCNKFIKEQLKMSE